MGIRTGTHLEALTEATGAMTVAAMQDMSFGFGIWDVLAEVRVRMPRVSADFQGGHVGGRVNQQHVRQSRPRVFLE